VIACSAHGRWDRYRSSKDSVTERVAFPLSRYAGSCNSRFEGVEVESNLLSMRKEVFSLVADRTVWRIRIQKTKKQRLEDNYFVDIRGI
jgi:hypothetical protein